MCVLSCSVARVRWLPWECYGHYDGGVRRLGVKEEGAIAIKTHVNTPQSLPPALELLPSYI